MPLCIALVCRVILLGISLLVLLRMQDLNYNIPGLLASATLASGFDLIPFVGHYIAVSVLLLCVLKLTRAHFVDVRFTVVVSYAVMFLMQMLILSALPGDLRAHARTAKTDNATQETLDDEETDGASTNQVVAMAEHPVVNQATNKSPTPIDAAKKPAEPIKTVAVTAALPSSTKSGSEIARSFKLNGVVANSRESTAMISTGVRTYTIAVGEKVSVETGNGRIDVSLEKVTGDGVTLNVGGESVPLRLR